MAQELGSQLITTLRYRYLAQKSEAKVNLSNYTFNAVGVSEHPNVVDEVDKLVRKIDEANSLLETIKTLGYGNTDNA